MARPAITPREKVFELFKVYPVLSKSRVAITPEVEQEFLQMVEEGIFKMDIKTINTVMTPVFYLAENEEWVKNYWEQQAKK